MEHQLARGTTLRTASGRAPTLWHRSNVVIRATASPVSKKSVRDELHCRMEACHTDALRLAASLLSHESPAHILEPAALVNELYLKLVAQRVAWRNREHFLALCSRLMRRILIDHARRSLAAKRATPAVAESARCVQPPDETSLTLEQVLMRLATRSPRQHQVVRLRFLVGLTIAETAAALGISPATVKLEWRRARCWLREQLASD